MIAVGFALTLLSCSRSGQVSVAKVVKAPFDIKIHATGQLQSAASLYVGCPSVERMWQYTISSMAPEGKAVNQGDLILSFDPRELMQRLQLKQSELDTGMKELERMQLQEQQTKEDVALQLEEDKVTKQKAVRKADYPEELIAVNELQKRKMELELADLQEKLAESRLANQISGMRSRIHIQETKVRLLKEAVDRLMGDIQKMNVQAAKPGIVVYTPDWDGKKKAVGDMCWMGMNILELPDLSRMQMKAVILEVQAGRVATGQSAEVRLDSNPDRVYKGVVLSLGRVFRVKSESQPAIVFDALVDLTESDPGLMRPGMAAGVDITVSSKANVLQVPEAAIVYQENKIAVWKKGAFSKELTPVTVGARSSGMVEVLSGLKENDKVVIRGGAGEGGR
jgi:HlyD family secretion protein